MASLSLVKLAKSCYFFFRSSAPYIGSDLRDVGEECQRK